MPTSKFRFFLTTCASVVNTLWCSSSLHRSRASSRVNRKIRFKRRDPNYFSRYTIFYRLINILRWSDPEACKQHAEGRRLLSIRGMERNTHSYLMNQVSSSRRRPAIRSASPSTETLPRTRLQIKNSTPPARTPYASKLIQSNHTVV
jgi:hypothetical protein